MARPVRFQLSPVGDQFCMAISPQLIGVKCEVGIISNYPRTDPVSVVGARNWNSKSMSINYLALRKFAALYWPLHSLAD